MFKVEVFSYGRPWYSLRFNTKAEAVTFVTDYNRAPDIEVYRLRAVHAW